MTPPRAKHPGQAKRAARRSRAEWAAGPRIVAASPSPRTPSQRRKVSFEPGFTLIEMIAVVAIFALLVAIVAPNLGKLSGRTLRNATDALAARIDLARQRTVMTGVPHRVWIDLDAASYRLEWFLTEAEALGEEPPAEEELDLRSGAPLPLEAPRVERAFRPLPGILGRDAVLEASLTFRGVETPTGWIERGGTAIEFARDGTTETAAVFLDDDSGRALVIDVLPLAEAVRVSDAEG
jgi:prepilin-type N-terminal cleavage/methylation domain-containing protein